MPPKEKDITPEVTDAVLTITDDGVDLKNGNSFSPEIVKLLNSFVIAIKGKTDAQMKEIKDQVAEKFVELDNKSREDKKKNGVGSADFKSIAKEIVANAFGELGGSGGTVEKAYQDLDEVLPEGWLDIIIQSPDNYGWHVASLFEEDTSGARNFYVPTVDITNIPLDSASPGFTVVVDKANGLAVEYDANIQIKDKDLQDSIAGISAQIINWANYITSGQIDHAMISGDITTTHMDGDVTTATDYRHRQPGLRKVALQNAATTVDLAGSIGYEDLISIRKPLALAGIDPKTLAYIMDAYGYLEALATMSEARTVEKFGNRAIIVNGVLEMIAGSPVVVSPAMPLTLATGYVSATPALNVKSNVLCVNRRAWRTALRMGMEMRMQQIGFETTFYFRIRKGIAPLFPTKYVSAVGVNL